MRTGMTPPLSPATEPGRNSAMLVYVLYLLSIPSAAVFALLGVILALSARAGAGPLARSHLDYQVKIWFKSFWWTVVLIIVTIVGAFLAIVLVGFPIMWLAGIGFLVIFIWFTAVSLFGLLALLDNRPR